jgi:hypothetical protein
MLTPRLLLVLAALFLTACGGQTGSTDASVDAGPRACVRTGCGHMEFGRLCLEEGAPHNDTCDGRWTDFCYNGARCERQTDGQCGWTDSEELRACLADAGPPMR